MNVNPDANVGWDEVTTLHKKSTDRPQKLKGDVAVQKAMRSGAAVETSQKFGAGGNRQKGTDLNTLKLDEETENFHHKHVELNFGKRLQQARLEKKMTQKDLATKINEKPQIVQEYENGKAIPNNQIISKMERALGVKLRGKKK
eukprot:Clim_evm43s148 gene=Clim_evmTU43s148